MGRSIKAKTKVSVRKKPVKARSPEGDGGIFTAKVVAIVKKEKK